MSDKKTSISAQYLLRLGHLSERQAALRQRLFLALGFGLCAFAVAVAPARDQKQGALAQAQAQADSAAIARFKRLKDPRSGYARVSELRFSQAGYEPATTWGALTRVEPLPYGMGFAIDHAFASRDACAAYAPLALQLADELLIDQRKAESGSPEALCSQGQNNLRLIMLDPGELQRDVARAQPARSAPQEAAEGPETELKDPRIPGGYHARRALKATPEQLAEAERASAQATP